MRTLPTLLSLFSLVMLGCSSASGTPHLSEGEPPEETKAVTPDKEHDAAPPAVSKPVADAAPGVREAEAPDAGRDAVPPQPMT